jgi:hypothetical protein
VPALSKGELSQEMLKAYVPKIKFKPEAEEEPDVEGELVAATRTSAYAISCQLGSRAL